MTQTEVYRLLKSTHKSMTAHEVDAVLKIGRDSATRKLNQLAKYGMITKTPHKVRINHQRHLIFKFRVAKNGTK
jgi:predicted transcriptional regulator